MTTMQTTLIKPADPSPSFITPVVRRDGYTYKRDDAFRIAGVCGGKVRACWHLAQGATGLVTAGSRKSPQVNIVAHIAHHMGIPCRVHVPGAKKPLTAELEDAKAFGAEIMEQWPGHNSVIIARARADAKAHSYTNIPFGMECMEAVNQTRQQVANIPPDVKRIVIPVGSGMSLAGVLWGLNDKRHPAHVLGIVVGANPAKRLNKFAPNGWHRRTTLMEAGIDYHKEAPETVFEGINLDPIYEAKCIPFMEEGDLLWIVGIRRTAEKAPESEGTVGTNNIIAVKNTKQHKDV